MLVLSRKEDQTIVLIHQRTGERIELMITALNGSRVSIGIEASQEWKTLRGELTERQDAEAK